MPSDVPAAKAARRRTVLARRAERSSAERSAAAVRLTERLLPRVLAARRVAAYVSLPDEPGTAQLLEARPDLLLPVLLEDGDLDWAVAGTGLTRGRAGTQEPSGQRQGVDAIAGCDLVLVPALSVDRTGTRLGRGGGSYDRALARATGLTVALLYDGELVDRLPAEVHDRPVGAVVTPDLGLVLLPPRGQ